MSTHMYHFWSKYKKNIISRPHEIFGLNAKDIQIEHNVGTLRPTRTPEIQEHLMTSAT